MNLQELEYNDQNKNDSKDFFSNKINFETWKPVIGLPSISGISNGKKVNFLIRQKKIKTLTNIIAYDEVNKKIVIQFSFLPFDMFINDNTYPGIGIHTIGVNLNYQGQNLGLTLYQSLILQANWTLVAIGSQSIGARKMWLKMFHDPQISIWGRYKHKFIPVTENSKLGELKFFGFKNQLYKPYAETLLLATRKDSAVDKAIKEVRNKQMKIKEIVEDASCGSTGSASVASISTSLSTSPITRLTKPKKAKKKKK